MVTEVIEEEIEIEFIVPDLDFGLHKISLTDKLIKLSDRGSSIENEMIILRNMQELTNWEITLMATDVPDPADGQLQLAEWMRFGNNIDDFGIYNTPVSLYKYDSSNPVQLTNWSSKSEYIIAWSDLEAANKDIRVINSPARQAGIYKAILTWSVEIVP